MGKIHLLSEETVSRIAAGEVIERPASVVKELIENSIDAVGTRITVYIKQAGKTCITVKDNGCGIEKDDLDIIFERHATSKIHSFEDLYKIRSMGFRGEALYSIGSVAEVFLRSKTPQSETGWQIRVKNGTKSQPIPVAMQNGTEIEVHNLFFNVPARRKFLKSDITEFRKIIDVFIPYAIFFYSKAFVLFHDRKKVFDLESTDSMSERMSRVCNVQKNFLREITKKVLDNSVSIKFVLGDINIQRPRKDFQFIFINDRPVHHPGISFVINDVYRNIFPSETYPVFAVAVNLNPQDIDVNIHPTKREIRMKNETSILNFIRMACEEILGQKTQPKQPEISQYIQVSENHRPYQTELNYENSSQKTVANQQKIEIQKQDFRIILADSKFLATIFETYLLFEAKDKIYLIDQHAAHERIIFEKLHLQAKGGKIQVEQLLVPVCVNLSPQEMFTWESGGNTKLEEIGFQTTKWDKNTVAIHTKPVDIKDSEIAIRNILSENIINLDIETLLKKACRRSTMAGEKFSEAEATELKNQLLRCKNPLTCPHGRPTIVEIDKKFIEKQFLR
ncbi:MAG: DNA mismatch repair endonuclease MutL [Candidatus Ratteibacteria bacterium]